MENSLGNLIKKAREEKVISQRELARRTGIDNTEISRIEKGTRKKPGYKVLKKLAEELGFDICELLIESGYDDKEMEEYGIYKFQGFDFVGYDRVEELQYTDTKGKKTLDLIMTLDSYKSGKLQLIETLGIISMIVGKDVLNLISEEHLESKGIYTLSTINTDLYPNFKNIEED